MKRFKTHQRKIALLSFVLIFFLSSPLLADDPKSQKPAHRGSSEIEMGNAAAEVGAGKLYALVVGISKYKDPKVPQLNVSDKDARDFAEFLKTQSQLFSDANITLLQNEEATKSQVEKHLYYKLRQSGKDDTVILFLSGHGADDPNNAGEFFFLTYDAEPDYLAATAVHMNRNWLNKLDSRRVVLIADACHSGGFSEWKTKAVVSPLKSFIRDFASSAGKVVISSSRPDEYSLESPRQENGVFTYWLLHGLKGAADQNDDGIITVNEAYNYAYQQTKLETKGAQHPQFQGTVEGVFPLSLKSNVGNRVLTLLELAADPPGADVLVGGRLAGKTDSEGTMRLKYLPVGRPIPIVISKEGWVKEELPPIEFSANKTTIAIPRVTLRPALASLEVNTLPGEVSVNINGQPAGKTDVKGKLIIDGLQVSLGYFVELEKQGFDKHVTRVTIPSTLEGKKAQMDQIRLSKVSTERPVDRIQKEYAGDVKAKGGGLKLRERPIGGVTGQDAKMLEMNPLMDRWDLEMKRGRVGRPPFGSGILDNYQSIMEDSLQGSRNRSLIGEPSNGNLSE